MKTLRKVIALALILLTAAAACGCMISSGVFIGINRTSTDTSLSASFRSFDGSLARRVKLEAGDEVTFSLEGGEGLRAVVTKGGELFDITDGGVFTAPEDGYYDFALKGKAKDGWFSLTWVADRLEG
jgi:hypothetical protein